MGSYKDFRRAHGCSIKQHNYLEPGVKRVLKLTTDVNNEIANMFTGRNLFFLKHVFSKHVPVLNIAYRVVDLTWLADLCSTSSENGGNIFD